MKKLITFIGALLISSAAFSQNNSIEGKWKTTNFDNTMYIFENGERFTYYCTAGNCDSLYNTYEAGDGNHLPGTEDYSVSNDTITMDYHFGNIVVSRMVFSCGGNIVTFVNQNNLNYVRLGTNLEDCNSASINEDDQNNFTQIYPNPASSDLNLLGEGAFSYQISDMSGKILIQGEVNESDKIRIADLNAGIYNITCITENKIQTLRFMKQ